ncbi:hypothetical protein N8G13_02915 [Mycoplasma zalophi]|uniref:hypothetical protein n=1 Tax=Mycoplasma zalophi TaxID=191287 RepID=UPI0021C61814|nr:hypothetical protein [Mycoplasma zalophi]MCU4117394.1 hypothetical protein [Mycoplasma zalophi]
MIKNKKKWVLLTLIPAISLVAIPAVSCVNGTSNTETKVNDLPLSLIQQIYDSFELKIKKDTQTTYEEFLKLFKQKYEKNNNDIYRTLKDFEISNIVSSKLMDINKMQPGHKLIIKPVFNSKTKQFALNIKVMHIQGGYIEGKEEGNNTIAKGEFRLFSEEDKRIQKEFLDNYVNNLIFKLKDNISMSEVLQQIDDSKLQDSSYVYKLFSQELNDKITFNLPQLNRPHDTVLAFNVEKTDQVKLVILLKNEFNSNVLFKQFKILS